MSAYSTSLQENRSSRLILIDEDPVFRLGLRVWLEQFPDLNIVAEAEDGTTALQILEARFAPADLLLEEASSPVALSTSPIDLVILDITLGRSQPDRPQGLSLCRQIRTQYPTLPVLILSASPEPLLLAAAQQAGASGYCPKATEVKELIAVIRQVATGQPVWIQPSPQLPSPQWGIRSQEPAARGQETQQRGAISDSPRASPPQLPNPLSLFRRNLRLSGIRQIDAALAELAAELQNLDLSLLDRAIAAGRYRELQTARWMVRRLLATPAIADQEPENRQIRESPNQRIAKSERQPSVATLSQPVDLAGSAIVDRSLQSVLFDAVLSKLQTSLENETETPLEIDILREDKKRELFYIILRKLEDLLDELRYSQVQPGQLDQKRSPILQDLWQTVIVDFFGKYYTIQLGESDEQTVEVVSVLLQDAEIVQTAILDKIPAVIDLLNHLLFQTPLIVDSTPYPPGNPAALARAELILDNWVIRLASGVMQPLLNRFANVEEIKQNFYDRRLLSNREIERFRNDLSWRYRLEKYVREPTHIFESQYQLFVFSWRGIKKTTIYAPRNQELEKLGGIQFAVTLALETRDAIAPRLRSVVSFVGNGVIYVLTEVIGRSIGLVGRGILKGIGNAWQDSRFSRK